MTKPKTIFVRAGDGLRIPLPSSVIVNSPVKHVTDSTVVEVRYGSFVRKRIKSGDLIEVKKPKADSKAKTNSKKAEA